MEIHRTQRNRSAICSVGEGGRLHLWIRFNTLSNEYPGYDTKQSDGEVPVMLGISGIRSTTLLPFLPGQLWPRMIAPDWDLSMG